MAKKIDGWSRYADISPSGRIVVRLLGESDYQCSAVTVVVHDDKREPVFAESEVRAMFRDLIEDQARCDVHNGWQSGVIPDFAGIAAKHGVSLDTV